MRAVPRSSRRRNTLNPSGIYLWRPALGDPRRPRLSRQMNEFPVFIAIFHQNVAIMLSLWGSPTGIRLWRMLFGDPRRPRLSRQMDEFPVFIVIFEQHVAIMSSLWGSPSGIYLWRPALGGPRRPRLSRQMDEFLVFIVIFRTKCRHNVEFLGFRACQTSPARRPRRTSQAQTVGEFW